MKPLLILLMACIVLHVGGQTANDDQVFTINTAGLQSFHLHNMNGPVTVHGIEGNVATLKVRRKLKSFSAGRLEEARTSITFDSITVGKNVYFFMKHPDKDFEIDENGYGHYNSCCNQRIDKNQVKVKYEFEIDVQVPKQLALHVSTHRKALKIRGINGDLFAKAHHNNLFADDLGGNVQLKAHHGDIKASFVRNPTAACSYSTHHGDISIEFREALAANVFLKSHHGDFFTDFDWTTQPVAVVENELKNGTRYVVNAKTSIRIGGGGPDQEFKTWHGDIYLLKAGQ